MFKGTLMMEVFRQILNVMGQTEKRWTIAPLPGNDSDFLIHLKAFLAHDSPKIRIGCRIAFERTLALLDECDLTMKRKVWLRANRWKEK